MEEGKQLKEAGLKITMPRVKVLQILEQERAHHMSAEEIYKALLEMGDDIGLATVYRVLQQFESAGLVSRHHFEGTSAVYELSEGEHHDHLVCVKCGAVEEFFDDVIEQRQLKIAEQSGYQMTDHALHIYGLCPKCH